MNDIRITRPEDMGQEDDHPPYKVPTYEGEDYSTRAIYHAITDLRSDQGTFGPLDGDDPIADNISRAQRAAEGVRGYAKQDGIYSGESIFLAISDFMNDLRHLLDFVALDDEAEAADGYPTDLEELASRDMHYQAEIRGEF
jgi:hypothetical protein